MDGTGDRGLGVPKARWLWAVAVSSLTLAALRVAETLALVGPAPVAMLAEPIAVLVVAGLVAAVLCLPSSAVGGRSGRAVWRASEPAWPASCRGWSVGRAVVLVAVHGRDGPGSRARRS